MLSTKVCYGTIGEPNIEFYIDNDIVKTNNDNDNISNKKSGLQAVHVVFLTNARVNATKPRN